MSGVSRLRAAHKGGGSISVLQKGPQKTDVHGGAKDLSDKSFGAPKKKGAWDTYPTTGVPIGNESPSRGEHPKGG